MEDQAGEGDRDEDAQLVDGDHDAGGTVLQRPVIAEPGAARRQNGRHPREERRGERQEDPHGLSPY